MSEQPYRFQINDPVPLDEAELTLQLSIYAVEGLFGHAATRLDVRYDIDEEGRALVVDASTESGAALVRVFAALLLREFGDDAFAVSRGATTGATATKEQPEPAGAAA